MRRVASVAAAVGLAALATFALFLILPVMQSIAAARTNDLMVRNVDTGSLPPPPAAAEEEPLIEEKQQPPEPPPELVEQAAPLDLSQIELALNPTVGDGAFGGFQVNLVNQLETVGQGAGDDNELNKIFSLHELDQRPRVVFQRAPTYPPEMRRAGRQGTVYVVFLVGRDGRVINPKVEKSTDPVFERSALEAVRQWKFEPGTRKGEKVEFKMRVPITFNAT